MIQGKSKELALICSYIASNNLLNGTTFQTFHNAWKIANDFLEEYPLEYVWGVDKEWDETLEEYINERYINGVEKI